MMILRAIFWEHLCSAISYLSRSFADCLRLMDKIWQSGWDGYNSAKWLMGFAYQLLCKIFSSTAKCQATSALDAESEGMVQEAGSWGFGSHVDLPHVLVGFIDKNTAQQLGWLDGWPTIKPSTSGWEVDIYQWLYSCLSWLKVGDFFHLSFSSHLKGQNQE